MKPTLLFIIPLSALALALSGCSAQQPGSNIADDANVATSCVAVAPSRPDNIQSTGVVILQDSNNATSFNLLNLATHRTTPLSGPDETLGQLFVSPDHKTLAFQSGDPKTNAWSVVVADSQGTRKKTVVWKPGFFTMGGWINNSQLELATYPPIVVVNPYTGQQQDFQYTDFPNYLDDSINNRLAVFDPTMTRVLYKSKNDHNTLLDLAGKKVLAELDNHPDPAPIAAWTPDGSQVAVVGFVVPPGPSTPGADIGHDIFSISRDGQVRRLTHLTDHYGRLLTISPAGLSWSPDARYLAFWILYPDSPGLNWELVVYDTTAQKATDYCITNAGGSIRPLDAPIWSPDGRQLLVESRDAQGNNRVVILDLAQETAFLLSDNAYAAGWLAP